jgi:hypothetical protein
VLLALYFQGEIDDHDRILFNYPNEKNDADDSNDRKLGVSLCFRTRQPDQSWNDQANLSSFSQAELIPHPTAHPQFKQPFRQIEQTRESCPELMFFSGTASLRMDKQNT